MTIARPLTANDARELPFRLLTARQHITNAFHEVGRYAAMWRRNAADGDPLAVWLSEFVNGIEVSVEATRRYDQTRERLEREAAEGEE